VKISPGQQKNWLLHHDNAPFHTSFFTSEFFYQKQHDYRPPPTLLFSVSPIEDKTERPPFCHHCCNEGRIAGDSEHSQNTTSRMHLKNGRRAGNSAAEKDYFEGDSGQ
jgi:hypothetical protein